MHSSKISVSVIQVIMLKSVLATLTSRNLRGKENDVACKSILYFIHGACQSILMANCPVDRGKRACQLCASRNVTKYAKGNK